jgi:hypothetical protein
MSIRAPLGNERQFTGGLAAFHVGMGLRRLRQYSPPNRTLSLPCAIQSNSCAERAKPFGRRNMVEEHRVGFRCNDID